MNNRFCVIGFHDCSDCEHYLANECEYKEEEESKNEIK